MRDVRFKRHGAIGPAQWTHATLPEFLFALPSLLRPDGSQQPIPPLAVLNELFKSGRMDAGMSGGSEWKPFEISELEYEELIEWLATNPKYNFVQDADLADITSLRAWQGKSLSKYVKLWRRPGLGHD